MILIAPFRARPGIIGTTISAWTDLAADNRTAAHELFEQCRWRSCTSRAYYAGYDLVTDELLRAGVTMPPEQNNPRHLSLPMLCVNNLHRLSVGQRWHLHQSVKAAYKLRVIADYGSTFAFNRPEARSALAFMTDIFKLLRRDA